MLGKNLATFGGSGEQGARHEAGSVRKKTYVDNAWLVVYHGQNGIRLGPEDKARQQRLGASHGSIEVRARFKGGAQTQCQAQGLGADGRVVGENGGRVGNGQGGAGSAGQGGWGHGACLGRGGSVSARMAW